MTLNLTRGGLVPAKLINLVTNEEIDFMFNPFEYKLTKANTWTREAGIGLNVPVTNFSQGSPIKLDLNMTFDTYTDNKDVRTITNKLWKLMLLDSGTENPDSHKGSPPPVAFSWGTLYFKAVIVSMTQNFTMFTPDGMPVRCVVTASLEQHHDDSNRPPQTVVTTPATRLAPRLGLTAMLGIAAATATAAAIITAVTSDRIDHVAQQTTGDAGNMRQVAERNNVDNPLKVRSGQTFS